MTLNRKCDFIIVTLMKSVMIILSGSPKDDVSYFHRDNVTKNVFVIVFYDNGQTHLILSYHTSLLANPI